jgi:hypothetical protein
VGTKGHELSEAVVGEHLDRHAPLLLDLEPTLEFGYRDAASFCSSLRLAP